MAPNVEIVANTFTCIISALTKYTTVPKLVVQLKFTENPY